MHNDRDLQIWNGLFANVPDEWKKAPPSQAMQTCATWLHEVGARDILDIGCGVGRWSVWLAKQGFQVWSADFAPRGVEYARQWALDEGLDIPVCCTPITERAFPDRRFDVVVAALVFDLVSKEEFELAIEVSRHALRLSGHLFAVFNPFEEAPGGDDNPTGGVTRIRYSDAEIMDIVRSAGYSLVRHAPLDQGTRGFLWRTSATSVTS